MIIFVDFVGAHLRVRSQVTYEIAYKNTPVQNFISYFLFLILNNAEGAHYFLFLISYF